ncbi:MAG TPA: hypothetical protein VJZ51_05535 [Bacilli bacterium]|nr:hypothetical protein [Bacilli bacterium]
MEFSTLLRTQTRVVKLLKNSILKNRLVGIYLFEGAKGTQKIEAAYYFAALVMCEEENKPCGECLSCKRIQEGSHPRIFFVEPGAKGSILKSQIDDLEHEFSRVSLEEGIRVFIIKDIDKATIEASNCLLKFLEETSSTTYGVLTTENLSSVISTIKSRSQIVAFAKVPRDIVIEEYTKRGIKEELSRVLSVLTNDINEGLLFANDQKINSIIGLVKMLDEAFWYKEKEPILVLNDEGKFLLNEKDKMYHNIFLDLMATIINDHIYHKLEQKNEVIFVDADFDIDCEIKELFLIVEKILVYKQKIKYNVNLELMYMQMLIEIVR